MVSKDVKKLIQKLVAELAKGNYSIIKEPPFQSRCNPEDIARVIEDYGRTITNLPNEAFNFYKAIPVKGEKSKYALDVDLWTKEQGRSDLTLQLTVSDQENLVIEVDDLHIL